MRKIREQKGAFAPFVAILIILLILAVGLVVDLGHIHNVRIELQRAVDAAALAGAGQLSGDSEQESRAIAAAEAMAEQNNVDAENISVVDDNVITTLGFWDDQALGTPAEERFDETETPVNAVRVEATREVDHWFFFLIPSSEVTANAIAVNIFKEETIPIALVSCIPTGGGSLNVASPGLSVCDITTYEFHSDNEDTSAWTSLTFNPASNTLIQQFLTEEGRALFNEVVYGTNNNSHEGIENTEIETLNRDVKVPDDPAYSDLPRGCLDNDGTSIDCGLGVDISLDPESIVNIRKVDPDYVQNGVLEDDPLTAYIDGLPRWYHFDDPNVSPYDPFDPFDDAFTRMWTMDGHLVPPPHGTGTQAHLQELFETPDGVLNSPYGEAGDPDFRFKKFIEPDGGGTYKPDYNEVLRYAGYPPVWVNNGTIPPALDTFLERIADLDTNTFNSSVSTDNEPFNSGNESNSGGSGYTVQLTIPVIFAGDCEEWKAISNGPVSNDNKLYYVGTANFLVTRAWKNPNCFQQASNPLIVSNWTHSAGNGCGASDFDPPLAAGDAFECVGGPGSNPNAGLEGLIRPPTRGANAQTGIRSIFLVK